MKRNAIIVAGGKGTRMKADVPKQFLLVDGIPIIVRTINKFLELTINDLIIVLPGDSLDQWEEIWGQYLKGVSLRTAEGGETRSDSVRAGLSLLEEGLVAIHDAVRPYVSTDIIEASFVSAEKFGSGVVAIPLKDSIREIVSSENSIARDRSNYRLVQTPQTFKLEEIKKAYESVGGATFTDDATVYEQAGYKVHLVEGDETNIKITTRADLK